MSQTNKEETLTKLREVLDGDYYNKQEEDDAFYNFLTQFATQQTTLAVEEKQRDIEFWKNKHTDKVHNLGLANKLSLERWEQLCLKDKEIEKLTEVTNKHIADQDQLIFEQSKEIEGLKKERLDRLWVKQDKSTMQYEQRIKELEEALNKEREGKQYNDKYYDNLNRKYNADKSLNKTDRYKDIEADKEERKG